MLRSIVFAIALLAAVSQPAGFARSAQQHSDSQSSILQVKSETVSVKLVDAFSGEVISNSDVNVHSDNGIRCCCAPCPTNRKEWAGRSSSNGYVAIPTSILQAVTNISTPTYKGGKDLIRDAEQDADGAWVVELIPNRIIDGSGPFLQHRKLVDAESNRPLIDTRAHISFGAGDDFDGQTNSLGYIFFQLKRVNFQIGDWLEVTGYKRTKINWGWANYKMKLERQ